jgi:hypothetical protein
VPRVYMAASPRWFDGLHTRKTPISSSAGFPRAHTHTHTQTRAGKVEAGRRPHPANTARWMGQVTAQCDRSRVNVADATHAKGGGG